jgi:hypothetical protein
MCSKTEYEYYKYDESAEVPVLCQNTDSNFSDLFKSLHENPNFSSGLFGAATVALLFGLCLLSQVRRSCRHQKTDSVEATQEVYDNMPTVSPRSACLDNWRSARIFNCSSFSSCSIDTLLLQGAKLGLSNLLLSVSLGVAVQLCLVLWSTFGNLFFDETYQRSQLVGAAEAAAANRGSRFQ